MRTHHFQKLFDPISSRATRAITDAHNENRPRPRWAVICNRIWRWADPIFEIRHRLQIREIHRLERKLGWRDS